MAETNTTTNYISNYSGDQLDAAIAVLGSLKNLFITKEEFDNFRYGKTDEDGKVTEEGFDTRMKTLNDNLSRLLDYLNNKLVVGYVEVESTSQNNNK